jgi:hypothetical protein
MRDLTEQEKALLSQRRDKLFGFVEESLPVMADFLGALGISDPYSVAEDAERFLNPLDVWLKEQTVSRQDHLWLLTRIGYFIGELLSQRFGGRWLVDDDPESPYFQQFVVSDFKKSRNENVKVSPFSLAREFVNEGEGRSLVNLMERAGARLL